MPKKDTTKIKKEKNNKMKSFKTELKKVIWPTPKQLFNNTVAVVSIVLIIAFIVFILDFVFERANTGVVTLVETLVPENEVSVENEVATEDEDVVEQAENVVEETENTAVEESAE